MWLWVEGTVTFVEDGPKVTPDQILAVCKDFILRLNQDAIEKEALERLNWGDNSSVTKHVIDIILERLQDAAAESTPDAKIHSGPNDGSG